MSSIDISTSASSSASKSTQLVTFHNTRTNRIQRYAHENPNKSKLVLAIATKASTAGISAIMGFAMTFMAFVGVSIIVIASTVSIAKFNGYPALSVFKHLKVIASSPFALMIPSKYHMSTHVYMENEYISSDGLSKARLAYEGDVPVLTLKGDPEFCGVAHGFLLAAQIHALLETWDSILWLVIPHQSKAQKLCDHLKTIIPQDYLTEMNGLVKGYNMTVYGGQLTLEKVLLLHLVPDIEHTYPNMLAKSRLGCTVVLDEGDENTGPIFGRHMDWPSLDIAGKMTLVIRRILPSGEMTHEIGIPGLSAGTVTGMKKSNGFSVAMNVALGKTKDLKDGLPAIILNRMVLDQCNSVKEGVKLLRKHTPLGPYHLTLADETGGATIHFYQNSDDSHHVRSLKSHDHIVTTNCRYANPQCSSSSTSGTYRYRPYFNSEERHNNIELVYQTGITDGKQRVEEALKTPLVNNIETTLSAILLPRGRRIEMAFANAFAADYPRQAVLFPEN